MKYPLYLLTLLALAACKPASENNTAAAENPAPAATASAPAHDSHTEAAIPEDGIPKDIISLFNALAPVLESKASPQEGDFIWWSSAEGNSMEMNGYVIEHSYPGLSAAQMTDKVNALHTWFAQQGFSKTGEADGEFTDHAYQKDGYIACALLEGAKEDAPSELYVKISCGLLPH
ncbi:hypothetical protein L1281_002425 [Neisseria sp. HSC-16F19]|nr:hypothetical protein [Neisseria sp. HSC-16F19]MCP2041808.1 hypothetical protein [Neisseria sp. HSC-16F19]